jgi:molecular chaperone GrpE
MMAAWFRKTGTGSQGEDAPKAHGAADAVDAPDSADGDVTDIGVTDVDGTDTDGPTGQISGARLSKIIEEAAGTGERSEASQPDVEPVGLAAPSAAINLEQALADRKALIQLCLYAMDRARSSGVAERIEHGLTAIGVTAMRPEGQRFDPALHEAGGAVPTGDATLEGTVAETEVVGFADRGRLLRAPVVTVYTRR